MSRKRDNIQIRMGGGGGGVRSKMQSTTVCFWFKYSRKSKMQSEECFGNTS